MNFRLNKVSRKFTEIYNDYYALVYSTVYSKVSDADDAGDITQEVFMRFFERAEEVIDPRKWLYGTLRNVVLEYYRKKRGDVDIDEVFGDLSLTFVNGFRESRIMIQEAIEDMGNFKNEKDKIIFDLIAQSNFTYREAGEQLGLTERQVRYSYSQTVERIVDYFRKRGINSLEELL